MDFLFKFLILCIAVSVSLADDSYRRREKLFDGGSGERGRRIVDDSYERRGRQMFNRLSGYKNRDTVQLPLCTVDGTVGACMRQAECRRERGLFAGYCGVSTDVCCVVDRTCDDYTKSHHTYFRNPSYPNNDTEARTCPFTIEIGRGVCGIRLDFETFVLAKFEDGVCIRDTLTILGTKLGPTTPICGNMTNWSTSFGVEERKKLVLAMVLQGDPAYTFSIKITQLACDDIAVFQSPTFAGVRNEDAATYIPTTKKPVLLVTTTEKPDAEETTDMSPAAQTTTGEPEAVQTTTVDDDDDSEEGSTDMPGDNAPTTLKPGVIPKPVIREVQISALEDSDNDVYLETIDSTPAISAFRRAFELIVKDTCWQYETHSPATFRVIGGSFTGLNEYPWQVALVYNKKFFCGGSLISDRHVLTAAHCVFGSFSKGMELLRISLGDHDLSTKNETVNIVSKVKHIFWHLHYNPHTTSHDIAILELEKPVDFRYGVSAVKLPADLDDMYEEQNATVTGWGRYNTKLKATSPVMKEYTGPLMKTSDCVKAWNKFPGIAARSPNHVCLDVTMGTPCHGDSGGPLVTCSGVQCTQIGVVSFGFPMCTNVGLPAVFTRISHYKPWIDMSLTPLDFNHYG